MKPASTVIACRTFKEMTDAVEAEARLRRGITATMKARRGGAQGWEGRCCAAWGAACAAPGARARVTAPPPLSLASRAAAPPQDDLRRRGLPEPAAILDVGCSTGISCRWLADAFPGASITGLDASPYFLAVAEYEQR